MKSKFLTTLVVTAIGSALGQTAELRAETSMERPTVVTRSGPVAGVREGDLRVFRGIPYAKPPVGDRRWRPPETAVPWEKILDASKFGPACLQKIPAQEAVRNDGPQSEDCLTLNVWVPDQRLNSHRLPVMVWIHGGSFRFGAGSLPIYDGGDLARRGAIVITVNYRLGLFGTFAHPELMTANEPAGNFGLLDVIQALRWVKENASAFGGDASNVTLFGESAGGAIAAYLMTSPLAKGLFSKAIVQSGAVKLSEYDLKKAISVANRVATELNAYSLDDLRHLPAETIRDANTSLDDTSPFIDGRILPYPMQKAFDSGNTMKIPIIIGSNDFEAGFFGSRFWSKTSETLGESWASISSKCFGYGALNADACAAQVASEQFAGVPTREVARAASKYAPVYYYRFSWVPADERDKLWGAIHTAEIPYVFGHLKTEHAQPENVQLSAMLADRWVAFARSGSPNINLETWLPLQSGIEHERLFLIDSPAGRMTRNPAADLQEALARVTRAHQP